MNAVGALVGAELRRLVRDRIALLFILVMPVAVIVIIGATIGGASRQVTLGILDQDRSVESQQVVAQLQASGKANLTTYDSLDDLERDLRTSQLVAGVRVPAGFGAAAARGDTASVTVAAVQQQDAQAAQPIVQAAVDTVGSKLAATAFVMQVDGLDRARAAAAVDGIAGEVAPVPVEARTVGTPQLESDNQFSYTAPSNLVLFLFITSLAAGGSLVENRRLGIARRMMAAPVGTGAIVLGFATVRLVVTLVQASLIIGVGALVFGVSWGQPAGVAVLVLVYALMAVGAGLVVGAVARNAEQATAIGIPVGIALGMLGGCMWPLDIVPPGLRAVGHLTPQAWAMDGFIGLVFDGEGLVDIARDVAVLALFAVSLLTLGMLLLRRALDRAV